MTKIAINGFGRIGRQVFKRIIETHLFEPDGSQSRRPNLFEKTAEELVKNLNEVPEEIRTAVRNNAGGHVNHSMFWQIMASNTGGEPSGVLAEEIKKNGGKIREAY